MADLHALYRGDTREYDITFTDAQGDAIDITGWKVYFTMTDNNGNNNDDNNSIRKDITEHESPTEGKTKILLTALETDSLHGGKYWYDIQVKKTDNTIHTVAHGKIPVIVDITRRTT